MALIKCGECGKEYSDKAPYCPNCGCPTSVYLGDNSLVRATEYASTTDDGSYTKKKSKKELVFILCGIAAILGCMFLVYFFLSPKTVSWCCYHRITKRATCTEPTKCDRCGKVLREALGHKWLDATCEEPKICERCGKQKGDALGHKWIDATCEEPKKCDRCGEQRGDALGHNWKDATCSEPKTCRVCGITEGEPKAHKWVSATCTEPKHCSACKKTEGKALGHNINDYICSRCKKTFVTQNDIKNIIQFTNCRYSINYVGGVDVYFTIANKSSKKTIKYVRMRMTFYNSVADKIKDEITGKTYTERQYTGPLKPNKSERIEASAVFYNPTAVFYCPTYLEIEYTDGTVLTIDDEKVLLSVMAD